MGNVFKMTLRGAVSGVALAAVSTAAVAGGFAVREQSAQFQGSSFAGNAAGGALSSSFWNPAALATAKEGFSTESVFSILFTDSEFTPTALTTLGTDGTNTGSEKLVPASYAAYRFSPDFVLGVSLNAPFGLGSEVDNRNWSGRIIHESTKLTTYNLTVNGSYRLAPGFALGAGLQMEYASLQYKFASGAGANPQNAGFDVKDTFAVGYTLGMLWQPTAGTDIGLGYKSGITHDFRGNRFDNGVGPLATFGVHADLDLPDMVTLSLRQKIVPNWTLLGTVEWSNWSKFGTIPVIRNSTGSAIALLDAQWHDGWFYSVGLEHNYSNDLTLRTGVAYEKSPIQNATERLVQVPDSDRIWLSAGLTYQLTKSMQLDMAYTHIFVEDAMIDRRDLAGATRLVADREASVDIFTLGLKTQWGAVRQLESAPLK